MKTLCMIAVLLIAATAKSDAPVSKQERITLARILVGEADGSTADWAAILWTLQHRKGTRGDLMGVAQYSSILRADTPRARQIRSLGTEDPEWGDLPERRRQHWEAALRFVDAWAQGDVRDPCPSSRHWGGQMDSKPAHRVTVSCGPTLNEFYYERGFAWKNGPLTSFTAGVTSSKATRSTRPKPSK